MYSKTHSLIIKGHLVEKVQIETSITKGMYSFSIIGVNSRYEKFIREKTRTLLKRMDIRLPNRNIVVNIQSSLFEITNTNLELAIICSILGAMGLVNNKKDYYYIAELDLTGNLIAIKDSYRYIYEAYRQGIQNLFLPYNDKLLHLTDKVHVRIPNNLYDVIHYLQTNKPLSIPSPYLPFPKQYNLTINNLIGHQKLIRALIIAVAGHHHTLISGPSGVGKTLSLRLLYSILPTLSIPDMLAVNAFNPQENVFIERPLLIWTQLNLNANSLIGKIDDLGILNKAKQSFLIFDELNSYSNQVIDLLKMVMENNVLSYETQDTKVNVLNDATILATMNLCPCGNFGNNLSSCSCSKTDIEKYNKKIDDSLIERFHIVINLSPPSDKSGQTYNLDQIQENIKRAWQRQNQRYKDKIVKSNGRINNITLLERILFDKESELLYERIINSKQYSQRQIMTILRLSRTIADYEDLDLISTDHIKEAIGYIKVY